MQHQNRLLRFPVGILTALFAASCSSQVPSAPQVSPAESKAPFPLPQDSSLTITSDGEIDLPPALVADSKVPAKALFRFKLDDHIVATNGKPPRSHQHGTMSLLVSTPDGSRKYIQSETELDGDFDGTPTDVAFREVETLLRADPRAHHPRRSRRDSRLTWSRSDRMAKALRPNVVVAVEIAASNAFLGDCSVWYRLCFMHFHEIPHHSHTRVRDVRFWPRQRMQRAS